MKKPLPQNIAIRKMRLKAGLTQKQLADKAKISIQYVKMIEGGYGAISDEVKRRIAAALNYSSLWALFPDVRQQIDLYNVLVSRFGSELVIWENEVSMFKEVLSRMDESEFSGLIWSGTIASDVHQLVRAWAKDHDIEVVE